MGEGGGGVSWCVLFDLLKRSGEKSGGGTVGGVVCGWRWRPSGIWTPWGFASNDQRRTGEDGEGDQMVPLQARHATRKPRTSAQQSYSRPADDVNGPGRKSFTRDLWL